MSNTNTNTALIQYNIIIRGIRFEFLLCSVYASCLKEARRLAKLEVLDGEDWYLRGA